MIHHEINTYKSKLDNTENTLGKLESVFGKEKLGENIAEVKEEPINTFRSDVNDFVMGKKLESLAEVTIEGSKTAIIKAKIKQMYE